MAEMAPIEVLVKIDQPEIVRALDDLHAQFEQTSKIIAEKYSGGTVAVDRGTRLIETYSTAVERVIRSIRTQPLSAGTREGDS